MKTKIVRSKIIFTYKNVIKGTKYHVYGNLYIYMYMRLFVNLQRQQTNTGTNEREKQLSTNYID